MKKKYAVKVKEHTRRFVSFSRAKAYYHSFLNPCHRLNFSHYTVQGCDIIKNGEVSIRYIGGVR